MCTEFCMCPGMPGDDYYDLYAEIPELQYAKFNRTKEPGTDRSMYWSLSAAPTKRDALNMMACFDNAADISQELVDAGVKSKEDAEAEKEEIEANKPDQLFIDIVSHIEEKYKCSGLCQKPLFYFTQDITNGPPVTPCLEPLVEDIGLLMQNLGATFLVTGILFIFMIFIAVPLCCYNKEEAETEADQAEQDAKS